MVWFIVALVVVCATFLAGYRKLAAGFVVAAVLGGVALYLYNDRKEQRETAGIPVSEVVIENVMVKPTFRSSYDVSGQIKNNSEVYRLDGVSLDITLRDCQTNVKTNCVVLGQATAHTSIAVAPKQTRDFITSIFLSNDRLIPKGTLVWDYEVAAITAKRR